MLRALIDNMPDFMYVKTSIAGLSWRMPTWRAKWGGFTGEAAGKNRL